LDNDEFDLLFCDFDSCDDNLCLDLKNRIKARKKVLFCTPEDDEFNEFFDLRIHKPFLPSEVSNLIIEIRDEVENETNSIDTMFEDEEFTYEPLKAIETSKEQSIEIPSIILPTIEVPKIDTELPKVEVAEIEVQEPKVDLELPEVELPEIELQEPKIDLELPKVEMPEVEVQEPKVDLELPKVEMPKVEVPEVQINEDDIFELDDEVKKEAIFDLDVFSDEITLEPIDTPKVLDNEKVKEIQELLEDNSALKIETKEVEEVEEKKEEFKSHIEVAKTKTSPVVDALISMPIESLRELLKGATVHITIQFPKD